MPASGPKQPTRREVRKTREALCLQECWRRNGVRLLWRRAKSKNPATRNRTRDHLIAAALYSQMLYQLSYSRSVGKGTCSRSFGDALRVCPSSALAPQIWNLAKKASCLCPTSKGFFEKADPGRTRTCNLWFRRPTPYPLGHRATARQSFPVCLTRCSFEVRWILQRGRS